MDEIISVNYQYVSGMASEDSCDEEIFTNKL